MTRIFSLSFNSLAPFEKTGNRFWEVMVLGMSPDAGDEFSKTILVRYILSYFCGTLYLDLSTLFKVSLYSLWAVFLAFQPKSYLA